MIDSEYFFIAEPESAVQIYVRELFAIRGFFRDFPRNVVFGRKLPIFFHAVFLVQQSGHVK